MNRPLYRGNGIKKPEGRGSYSDADVEDLFTPLAPVESIDELLKFAD
jgi:hypothetical protein